MTCPLCQTPTTELTTTPISGGPTGASADLCATRIAQLPAPIEEHA